MRKSLLATLSATALVLTACSTNAPVKVSTSSPPAPAQTAADIPATDPQPTETSDPVGLFGQTLTYSDGLAVTVTAVRRFKIGQYAAGGQPGDIGVAVKVTIANGTGASFDVTLATTSLHYGVDGENADSVFDSANNIGGDFSGSITKGRRASSTFGFAVPKSGLGNLEVIVSPGGFSGYADAHFTGKV